MDDRFERFRQQQEQYRRIFDQYDRLAGVGSPTYELRRRIEEQQQHFDSLVRRIDIGGELARTHSGLASSVEQFKALAVSPAYLDAVASLERTAAQYQNIADRIKQAAWLEMTSGIDHLYNVTLAELLPTVPAEVYEAALARLSSAQPQEPTLAALTEWLRARVEFFQWAATHLPPTRKVIAFLQILAKWTVITVASGVVQYQVSEALDAKKDRERARIEREHDAAVNAELMEIRRALEALEAREQFPALLANSAPVRLEPNAKGKRLLGLPNGARVKVLSRKGGWYEIEYGEGDVGWVLGKHLTRLDEPASSPQQK